MFHSITSQRTKLYMGAGNETVHRFRYALGLYYSTPCRILPKKTPVCPLTNRRKMRIIKIERAYRQTVAPNLRMALRNSRPMWKWGGYFFYPNSVLYCSFKMKIIIFQYIHIFLGQYILTIRKRIGTIFSGETKIKL